VQCRSACAVFRRFQISHAAAEVYAFCREYPFFLLLDGIRNRPHSTSLYLASEESCAYNGEMVIDQPNEYLSWHALIDPFHASVEMHFKALKHGEGTLFEVHVTLDDGLMASTDRSRHVEMIDQFLETLNVHLERKVWKAEHKSSSRELVP
jgi:hypothetical protein